MSKQLEFISGPVTSVNSKKTGIKVQGCEDWLNVSQYHPVPVIPSAGELVEVSFEQTDRGAWITSLKILNSESGNATSPPGRDAQIRRQVAMKTAAQLVGAFAQTHEEVKVEHVFQLADRVLEWLEEESR
jgi:hypothetical protein